LAAYIPDKFSTDNLHEASNRIYFDLFEILNCELFKMYDKYK